MDRDSDIGKAIKQKDVSFIAKFFFEGTPPQPKSGFRTETELWDYKYDCPSPGNKSNAHEWAEVSRDVLAFHNNRGGILIFGITDDFRYSGATCRLDSKLFNDQIRRYVGDRIWVEYHREFIQADQKHIGIALVPPRGPSLERFTADSPLFDGKRIFKKGESALREGDSTVTKSKGEVERIQRKLIVPRVGNPYEVNQPFFRILTPEYTQFVERGIPCKEVEQALTDPRTMVASIIGIGGIGKTALATWAVLGAHDREDFDFIVSITAKDRELTTTGIKALRPNLTSFESLLDNILEILEFHEYKQTPISEKEKAVSKIIENSNGLLFVDNLETIVDDPRIIKFLDNLPIGVRAITTSRQSLVKVSMRPIDPGPLLNEEGSEFIEAIGKEPGYAYISDLSKGEKVRIVKSCDGIPLAIRWALARVRSAAEALTESENIAKSKKGKEELLEFSFRRVFDALPGPERTVLQVLSLFQSPVASEALMIATGLPPVAISDAVETLTSDYTLVQRLFDTDQNDYAFSLRPITREFVYAQVSSNPKLEEQYRKKLSDWYEARDVRDEDERTVIREIRQGKEDPELPLLDLGKSAERKNDLPKAQELYAQALRRNPKSWKAARLFAEFHRHKTGNAGEAIRLYEQAAANAPTRGAERAMIFREWGMILRNSGDPSATELAEEKFQIALIETPNDPIAIHALADMLRRKGAWNLVIKLLEPLADHPNRTTRLITLPLLLSAYEQTGEILKAAEIRNKSSEATDEPRN